MPCRWSHKQGRQPLAPSTPLDAGNDDEDANAGIDTTVSDNENHDNASFTVHQFTNDSHPDLKLVTVSRSLTRAAHVSFL